MVEYSSVKLVIWDLDDTFWEGTLSEGEITCIEDNVRLIKELTDRGIINTICSKNDQAPVVSKLKDLGVDDLFVFKSIDWTPKGQRIATLIKDMGLRPENCLFLDDNVVNINEAKFYSKDLIVAGPDEIANLKKYVQQTSASDFAHKRLNQYKVLEQKVKAKKCASDNISFLYSTNTQVAMLYDCKENADRLYELVLRTNQLNFTKNRCSREDFEALLSNPEIQSGYVKVRDNFGDYGIVGFYAIKNHVLIHFLFSCRTIGQGVEQWVYSELGFPEITIVGDVVGKLERIPSPRWINQKGNDGCVQKKQSLKIVFKGPCDMMGMTSYLMSDDIHLEVTYGGRKQNFIEHQNHSVNYLQFAFLSNEERKEMVEKFIINDTKMFDTEMYDNDVAVLFLSSFLEPHLGIYRNKNNGRKFAWGHWDRPLTDKSNWESFINGTCFTHDNHFSEHDLEVFAENYEYIGRQPASEYIENIRVLFSRLSPNVHVCIALGSEMPFLNDPRHVYENRHLINKEYNDALREYAKTNSRLYLLDFNVFLKGQSDFTNSISHFCRRVYYDAAQVANYYIRQVSGLEIKQKDLDSIRKDSQLHVIYRRFRNRIHLLSQFLKRFKK